MCQACNLTIALDTIRDYATITPNSLYDFKALEALVKERQKNTRVYVDVKDESILENLGNRTSRPYKAWKPLVEAKLKEMGIGFEKIRWSQYAGCSCPCSPGFVVVGDRGKDIWMTVEGGVKTTDPELAAARMSSMLAMNESDVAEEAAAADDTVARFYE